MKSRRLSAYLAKLIWLCMTPLLLLVFWLAFVNFQEQEEQHLQEADNLAQNFASAIDSRLQAHIKALNILAVSPLADDPRRWPELYAEAQGFLMSFGMHVIFADHRRQMLFNTRLPYGSKLPMLPNAKGKTAALVALEQGTPQVGDIVTGPIANMQLLAIAVPVLRQGQPPRIMLSIFETSWMQQRVERFSLPAGWSMTLVDGTGTPIAQRSPPDFNSTRDVDSEHRFVAGLKQADWKVVVEIPRSFYWAQSYKTLGYLVLLIVLATALGLFGGVLASHRLVRQVRSLVAPAGSTAVAPDIAEIAAVGDLLTQAANDRQASESRFHQLFNLAPLPLGYITGDGRIVAVNSRFEQVFGYRLAEIPSTEEWWRLAYPDPCYREEARGIWKTAVAEAAATGSDIEPMAYRITGKDGSVRDMLVSGIVLPDGLLATFFDVTEQNRAERGLAEALAEQKAAKLAVLNQMRDTQAAHAALSESQQRLQLLIDHAPAALAMLDREMRYLAVSRRWCDDYALGDRPLIGCSH